MLIQKAQALAMGADGAMDGVLPSLLRTWVRATVWTSALTLLTKVAERRTRKTKATDLAVTRPIAPTLLRPEQHLQECLFRTAVPSAALSLGLWLWTGLKPLFLSSLSLRWALS